MNLVRSRLGSAVLGLCLAASGTAVWAQGSSPAAIKEARWQKDYDSLSNKLAEADSKFADLDDRHSKVPNPSADLKRDHAAALVERARALREVEVFLRKSPFRKRVGLTDLYMGRLQTARSLPERTAYLDQAESVLRESADFFAAKFKELPENHPARFDFRLLSIKARRSLADHLVDNVIYPALDEFEVFNQLNPVVQQTAQAVGEAVTAYRKALDEYNDLASDTRGAEERLRISAELDGYSQSMRLSLAWQSYYRAWLTPPPKDPKSAAGVQRKKDLEAAGDTFQEMMRGDSPVKAQATLGYALVTREQGQPRDAASELGKLGQAAEVTANKIQSLWELARTYGQIKDFERAIAVCDELRKLEGEAQKRDDEIRAAQQAGKDPPPDAPGRFYTQWSSAMRLHLLYDWKTTKGAPGREKAEEQFNAEAERLKKVGGMWPVLVESFVNKRLRAIIKDQDNPQDAELVLLEPAERLQLGKRKLDEGELLKAMPYLKSIVNDKQAASNPANKPVMLETWFELGKLYYQLYEKEKAEIAAAKTPDKKPDSKNIVDAIGAFQTLSKENPDGEKGKLASQLVPFLLAEIAKTFGPDEAQNLIGDKKAAALEDFILKNPAHPNVDGYRIALAEEYERYVDKAEKAADREKFVKQAANSLMMVKPGTPAYMYARIHAAELLVKEFYRKEFASKTRSVDPTLVSQTAEVLRESADVAMTAWKAADFKPAATPDQMKRWSQVAADYVVASAEMLCRPSVNQMDKAITMLKRYEGEFGKSPEEIRNCWFTGDLPARRMALQVYHHQIKGEAEAAEKLVIEFLKDPNANQYLSRLFNQTRRLIETREAEGKIAEAALLAKQLVSLGEKLLGTLPAADQTGQRGAAIRELILEMEIKSGDEALIARARDKADKYLTDVDKNNGQYQVFKCEALTKLALRTPDDNARWTTAAVEWKKLTGDARLRNDYPEFYWQSWWYLLGVRLEMAKGDKKVIQEIKDARKNLFAIYGRPTDKWAPRFEELDTAVYEGGSVFKR